MIMSKLCVFGPMLLCIDIDSPNQIRISKDKGHSWQKAFEMRSEVYELYVIRDEILAYTGKGFYYSKNGIAWSPRPSNIDRDEIYDVTVDGDVLIALTIDRDIFYSKNNGRTWSKRI